MAPVVSRPMWVRSRHTDPAHHRGSRGGSHTARRRSLQELRKAAVSRRPSSSAVSHEIESDCASGEITSLICLKSQDLRLLPKASRKGSKPTGESPVSYIHLT